MEKKKFTMTITPSIEISVRHKIEKVLEGSGLYKVTGAGTNLFGDSMDISFELREDSSERMDK